MYKTVHTFYIMFSHGQHYLQVEIDTKKAILETLIERFPNILKGEIAYYETLINEEARAAAGGDKDIEITCKKNSLYNNVVDFQESVLIYHYYSLAIMIYTFAESSLKQICEYATLNISSIKSDKLSKYYAKIKQQYDTLPILDEIWEERESFQQMRNKITHEMRTQNHVATQEYLKTNLEKAYNMLCATLAVVLISKK